MFCEACSKRVYYRKCNDKQNHYYHENGNSTFECENKLSDWHKQMQNLIPEECREVSLKDEKTGKHSRSDALLGRTTIEFQHSILPIQIFKDRITVNLNLNNRVALCVDLTERVENGSLKHLGSGLWVWNSPIRWFKDLDVRKDWDTLSIYLDLGNRSFTRVVEVSTNTKGSKSYKLFRVADTSIDYSNRNPLNSEDLFKESDFFTEKIEDYPELGLKSNVKNVYKYVNKSVCKNKEQSDDVDKEEGIKEQSIAVDKTGEIEEQSSQQVILANTNIIDRFDKSKSLPVRLRTFFEKEYSDRNQTIVSAKGKTASNIALYDDGDTAINIAHSNDSFFDATLKYYANNRKKSIFILRTSDMDYALCDDSEKDYRNNNLKVICYSLHRFEVSRIKSYLYFKNVRLWVYNNGLLYLVINAKFYEGSTRDYGKLWLTRVPIDISLIESKRELFSRLFESSRDIYLRLKRKLGKNVIMLNDKDKPICVKTKLSCNSSICNKCNHCGMIAVNSDDTFSYCIYPKEVSSEERVLIEFR